MGPIKILDSVEFYFLHSLNLYYLISYYINIHYNNQNNNYNNILWSYQTLNFIPQAAYETYQSFAAAYKLSHCLANNGEGAQSA